MDQNEVHEMEKQVHEKEVEELIQCLPKASFMGCGDLYLMKYQNFWYPRCRLFKNTLEYQRHFEAKDTDLIIASHPKTGTTWLTTLLFAVVNRGKYPLSESPILYQHPHHLVHRLEDVHFREAIGNQLISFSDLNKLLPPRLFSTHFPYVSLPESIKTSNCRILYICRNPLDTFVSQWHFYSKIAKHLGGDQHLKPYSFEDYFEDWLEGRIMFGPFFEHVVDYWMKSLERPEKILFLKYEDLKYDPIQHLKRVADFVGIPFSPEEESEGVITGIIEMCSINNVKELEVNKNGVNFTGVEKRAYFRKGEVGDWTNYFTPNMVERMNKLMQQKLGGTGLTFKILLES